MQLAVGEREFPLQERHLLRVTLSPISRDIRQCPDFGVPPHGGPLR
ncbi:hypothetical protein ACFFX0_16555 [Citricoccus parietis]|uniref:Uncharacterized protein n=1 Tax=Citricoccus parietis TaxID=592307 RepID=A0ABV5G1A8_9MICC